MGSWSGGRPEWGGGGNHFLGIWILEFHSYSPAGPYPAEHSCNNWVNTAHPVMPKSHPQGRDFFPLDVAEGGTPFVRSGDKTERSSNSKHFESMFIKTSKRPTGKDGLEKAQVQLKQARKSDLRINSRQARHFPTASTDPCVDMVSDRTRALLSQRGDPPKGSSRRSSVHSGVPAAPQLHGLTGTAEWGFPHQPPYPAENGASPNASRLLLGWHWPCCQGIGCSVCAHSLVVLGPEQKETQERWGRMNTRGRPSLS